MGMFDKVALPRVPRATFDLSFDNKLTFNMGTIVPIMCKEVVAGDTWKCRAV